MPKLVKVLPYGCNTIYIIICMLNVISGPIKFLTRLLRKAVDSNHHRYLGFAARELAQGLTRVAVNDNNKKTVMLLFTSTSF